MAVNWTALLKFGFSVVIFIVCFVGGILPVRLSKIFSNPRTLSLANCLSAGILMGASLIHLLFDAEDKQFDYPFAHLCCGVGFFVAFILEKVLFQHQHDHQHSPNEVKMVDPKTEIESASLVANTSAANSRRSSFDASKDEIEEITSEPASPSPIREKTVELETVNLDSPSIVLSTSNDSEKHEEHSHDKHKHEHNHDNKEEHKHAKHTAGWILFSVLALESFISGSACGVSSTDLGALVIFIAIITHIWAEAFALSATFLKSKMEPRTCTKVMIGFSFVTPVGIYIGMILQTVLEGEVALITKAMLISFAAGTFLYISIVEVMAEEFENGEDKWKKLNCILIGFAFMSALAAWI